MKVIVRQIPNFWAVLDAIYRANEILPGQFDYHMKYNVSVLRVEMQNLEKLTEKQRKEILDEEIELPLRKIPPTALPEKMPNNIELEDGGLASALVFLEPLILEEKQKEHKSAIGKLLKDGKVGKIYKEESELKKELNKLTKQSGADYTRIQLDPALYDILRHDDKVTEYDDYLVHEIYPDVKMFLMGSEIKKEHIGS